MELYIIENYKEYYPNLNANELTDELIKDCLEEHGLKTDRVLRTSKGKPYVEQEDVNFSVSHSGNYFLCLVADVPVGIDVQEVNNSKFERIAERYFTEPEIKYIKENGRDGFFKLWTRKEAYCKLTGEGISELIRGAEVLGRTDVVFTDFRLDDSVWCSYCTWADDIQ